MYKYCIFDLDGTLIDSIPDIASSMNRVLMRHKHPAYSHEEYRYFVGSGLKALVEKCLPPEQRTAQNIDFLYGKMLEEYGAHCLDKTCLYSGIDELLDSLTALNVKMAVLSNKAHELTKKICDALLSRWSFEMIIGGGAFPRKPDPTVAMIIARYMSATPDEVFYLGDTNIDMQTAQAAGFFPAGAAWGFRPVEELLNAGAKFIANKPDDVIQMFTAK